MCDYCVNHGYGKRWYLNARNYAKELAKSDYVRNFCEIYFGREIKPEPQTELKSINLTQSEQSAVDQRYRKYLHHQVISTEEVFSILQLASQQTENHERTVVLLPCICRYRSYGSDPDLHCFGIAFTSYYTRRFPKYLGGGHKYVSVEEACEVIRKMVNNETIVHALSALGIPYVGILCNCDMQVCRPYLHRLQLGISSPFYKAHYRSEINSKKCTGCGICEKVCPFGIAKLNELTNLAEIDLDMCYGCGNCVRQCPENAINLVMVDKSLEY